MLDVRQRREQTFFEIVIQCPHGQFVCHISKVEHQMNVFEHKSVTQPILTHGILRNHKVHGDEWMIAANGDIALYPAKVAHGLAARYTFSESDKNVTYNVQQFIF